VGPSEAVAHATTCDLREIPIRLRLRESRVWISDLQQVPWQELPNTSIDTSWSGHIEISEVCGESLLVDFPREVRQFAEGLQLGSERHHSGTRVHEHGLDADTVPKQP